MPQCDSRVYNPVLTPVVFKALEGSAFYAFA